jgi:polysaccharide export outer membrane protein
LLALTSGCEINDFINPGEPKIIDPNQKPLLIPVLDTLASGIEEPDTAFSNATDIEPSDLVPDITDYKIGPNDLLSISIYDLMGEGTGETAKDVRVTETGMVSLPFISPLKADGLTERELETAIQKAYEDARLIRAARVSVTVAEPRARTFSIQGNVGTPGEYQLTKPDFRMLDAMVTSRAPAVSIGVPYAYVIRKATTSEQNLQMEQPQQQGNEPANQQPPPMIPEQPSGPTPTPAPAPNQPATTPAPVPAPGDLLTPPPTGPTTAPSDLLSPPPTTPQGRANPQSSDHTVQAMDNLPRKSSTVFKFDDAENPTDQRIIRVPIDQLRQYGELKYNVVIRPGDMIIVPDPQTGVYYMGGHVLRPGAFGLNGEKITLKQAWVAAGGADDFAIPNRSEVIRRVGANREVCVRINLDNILALKEPDIYLKPNDVVYVGTDFFAPFIAALRNSFRITYGFGFLYDRNFYNGPNTF